MELIVLSDDGETIVRIELNQFNLQKPLDGNLILDEIRSAVQNYEPGEYELTS